MLFSVFMHVFQKLYVTKAWGNIFLTKCQIIWHRKELNYKDRHNKTDCYGVPQTESGLTCEEHFPPFFRGPIPMASVVDSSVNMPFNALD